MHTQSPEVKQLIAQAFPDFAGKNIILEPFSGPVTATSYWSGGSRDYWALISMVNGKSLPLPENGTPFSNGGESVRIESLPDGVALIRRTLGPRESAAVYLNPVNIRADMLPAPVELTRFERIVLSATMSLKSSYAGVKNYRFSEAARYTNITLEEWETAKALLMQNGMLNKAGAITDTGRNAIGRTNIWELKVEVCTAQ